GLLGGFHFNNRKYADDDLIAGSVDPFELFRIMHEIALPEVEASTAFMIDQSHNVEGKIDAMLQSVMNIQTAYAKALLIDDAVLTTAQTEGDVLGAHRALTDAFETDVRPLLARAEAAAARFGCRAAFDDAERMLDAVALDGVVVVVPPDQFSSVVRACIRRGVPVFAEKPAANDAAEAADLAAEAAESGVPVV